MKPLAKIGGWCAVLVGSAGSVLLTAAAGAGPVPRTAERAPGVEFRLDGWVRGYVDNVTEHWLRVVPASNPAILDMLRDRDRQPLRQLLPWSGEFAGKYLVSAVQVHRLTKDKTLRAVIADFVKQLLVIQRADGYLGPWPSGTEWRTTSPNSFIRGQAKTKSDPWGHYFLMLGLLLWHEDTGDPAALAGAKRVGDLLCDTFAEQRIVDIGGDFREMHQAPIHSLALLYERTGEKRYLDLAERIREGMRAIGPDGKSLGGDLFNGLVAGRSPHELPITRWEVLHSILAFSDLYTVTGDPRYRTALENAWWGIVRSDRHNNGGFSTRERAVGNPYAQGPIETCCTIAWLALGVEMLRVTGNPVVADELELATLNSVIGAHSPSGRWSTYDTPMEGRRKASTHDIAFQATAGGPELNCCSVNAARGFGLISDWALMAGNQALLLNWYGPATLSAPVAGAGRVSLTQQTDYPAGNRVSLRVDPEKPARFSLKLRIPHWSVATRARLNGLDLPTPAAGSYLVLERDWKPGDQVELTFDFSLQYWVGEREAAGKVSVYRGPLLLAYDQRLNALDPEALPTLDAGRLSEKRITAGVTRPPFLLLEFAAADGRKVRLCDFASAGDGGELYLTWLKVDGVAPTEFSRENPRRARSVR